jgi:hypothetical protein
MITHKFWARGWQNKWARGLENIEMEESVKFYIRIVIYLIGRKATGQEDCKIFSERRSTQP